ncbi:PadR family transcriptional regulator [Halorubrum sp. ARQ200]|uniref:PadR family transcriptional regulator n=1 Tax=Halorubrum sp. ARQ200 TaxID=1855872 RepID=UPI0010F4BAE0|nr:PadR family transcriptional regulator [Halorubrum sp. ARQ200]TKX44661.1 PadR family transcriptional regulator [Halorubrum sp. ARQ200]
MSSHTENDGISLADLSATHRDLLWVLSQTGPSESGPLHNALTDYYTDDIDHTRVCDILEKLVEYNYVTEQPTDSQYRLTESGRRTLATRQAWQTDTNREGGHE